VPNAHQVGGINVPAAIALAVMIVVFAASLVVGGNNPPSDADPPDDGGPGGGGGWRSPPRDPRPKPGGIPLDDAEQSRVRLRGARPPLKRPSRHREQREPGRRRTTPTRVNRGHPLS
jgi:hypothetical protein